MHVDVLHLKAGRWCPLSPMLFFQSGDIPAPGDTVVVRDSRWSVRYREWDLAQQKVYLYVDKGTKR